MKAMTGYGDEPAVDICGGIDLPDPPPYELLNPNLVGDAVDVTGTTKKLSSQK